MTGYMKISERRVCVRDAARDLLRSGVPYQQLSLKAVAAHLGWSLGTLHRAYSITATLLNDLLLEFEDDFYTAVFVVGDTGLHAELTRQVESMYVQLADEYQVQLMRYQMALACRSENPLELRVRNARDSSWAFTREMLIQVAAQGGEQYHDLDGLTSLVTSSRDGLVYQFFSHGDRERWRWDAHTAVAVAVAYAQPRKLPRRDIHETTWHPDLMPHARPDLARRSSVAGTRVRVGPGPAALVPAVVPGVPVRDRDPELAT